MSQVPDDLARNLPALLAARAESAPAAPWLIYRHRLDWSWRSCEQVADQVARIASDLDVEAGTRFAVPQQLDPDGIALDVSVQSRGGTAVAVAEVESTARLDLPAVRSRLHRWQPIAIDLRYAGRSAVEVTLGAAPAVLAPEAMAARIASVDSQWRPFADLRKPVALACGTLRDPGVWTLVAWTLTRGAVLALEPDPALAAQAVGWIRPHIAIVPQATIVAVHEAVAKQKKRWRRLVLIGVGEEGPSHDGDAVCSAAVAAQWQDLGVGWLS